MRISSFGQTNSTFDFKAIADDFKKKNADKIADEKKKLEESIKNNKNIPQTDLGFTIEMAINDSCKFLHEGLSKIFIDGESTLAGRTSKEYDKHIEKLSEAIQLQDYKKAEKLIDKFFGGSTDKIVGKIKMLAEATEDKFWNALQEGIEALPGGGPQYNFRYDGKTYEKITMKEMTLLALRLSREEVDPFSDQDFSGITDSIRKAAVDNAKVKLEHAGRNKYSEDAVSVTASAAEFSRNRIFNTNDTVIKEDKEQLADIYALEPGEKLNQEQIERLKHRNTRKTDTFHDYAEERVKRFYSIYGTLKSTAMLVKKGEEEQKTPDKTSGLITADGALGQQTAESAQTSLTTPTQPLVKAQQDQIQLQNEISNELLHKQSKKNNTHKTDAIEKYKTQQAKWEEYLSGSVQEDK
ncbi:hypothetical protein [Maridesulfovibrio salexigens]|uniref:Uncharacterized protein n=1 Tax=Maridesulfovibrio salexigens (strain ATCC 14822 / DSM 2638 / NCIMB 8403 / VKM B-1763) TaxID=526222 RepID=C6BZ91_MARSD|nr:hypothetical protein [Maridesulfovibrio salexigens]ACS78915.1 hypothetical protein Desal_0849 [Maridesulfovibrio salexigens DSM 2638]